ncbi:MAG: hypothetical protein PHU23_18175, partial [Dehalococcoidales bacterium]|nr:hypothetical protein [Dehalococcoidales bacterium]
TKTNEDFSRTATVSTTVDKDSDNDGIPDVWEDINQLDKFNNDAQADPDNDTLNNLSEYQHNTNPQKSDSDGDGYSDTEEIQAGSNPNDKNSIPIVLKPPVLEALGIKQTGSTVAITFKNTGEQPAYISKITKVTVPSGIKCSDVLPIYLSSEIQPGTTAIATLHFNTINRVRLGFNLEWQDNKGNVYSK